MTLTTASSFHGGSPGTSSPLLAEAVGRVTRSSVLLVGALPLRGTPTGCCSLLHRGTPHPTWWVLMSDLTAGFTGSGICTHTCRRLSLDALGILGALVAAFLSCRASSLEVLCDADGPFRKGRHQIPH